MSEVDAISPLVGTMARPLLLPPLWARSVLEERALSIAAVTRKLPIALAQEGRVRLGGPRGGRLRATLVCHLCMTRPQPSYPIPACANCLPELASRPHTAHGVLPRLLHLHLQSANC